MNGQLCLIQNFPSTCMLNPFILCSFNIVHASHCTYQQSLFLKVFLAHLDFFFFFKGDYMCIHEQCSIRQQRFAVEVHAYIISQIAGRFEAEKMLAQHNECLPAIFYNDLLQFLLYVKPYAVLYCQLSCLAQSNDVIYPQKSSWIKGMYKRVFSSASSIDAYFAKIIVQVITNT